MVETRRGQRRVGVNTFFAVILVGFIILVGMFTLINNNRGAPLGQALESSLNDVSSLALRTVGPVANVLLGLDRTSDTNIQFLMILTFILTLIVIVAALDTASLFGEQQQGHLLNVVVGAIIAIIGIRFMPLDLWSSLTAPSSAFVAVLVLALPFAAFFALTLKLRSTLARKLLWLLYVVFVGFIIGDVASSPYLWAYLLFGVLAILMMAFDGTVRSFISREKHKVDIAKELEDLSAQQRFTLRQDIKKWSEILADPHASKSDRNLARKNIDNYTSLYGDISMV